MKRALYATVLASVCAAAIGVSAASAFDNRFSAIALHVKPVGPRATACTDGYTNLKCGTLNQQTNVLSQPGQGPYYYVYLLVCNASDSTKVGGFECGIQYDGGVNPSGNPGFPLNVFDWTSCSDLEFQSTGWPAPGGGNAMTWTTAHCRGGRTEPGVKYSVVAIGGYFYVGAYAPSQMFITPRPVSGTAAVADCAARVDVISGTVPTHLGSAGFGMVGFNPCCAPTPTEPTTWGNIKGQYGR